MKITSQAIRTIHYFKMLKIRTFKMTKVTPWLLVLNKSLLHLQIGNCYKDISVINMQFKVILTDQLKIKTWLQFEILDLHLISFIKIKTTLQAMPKRIWKKWNANSNKMYFNLANEAEFVWIKVELFFYNNFYIRWYKLSIIIQTLKTKIMSQRPTIN